MSLQDGVMNSKGFFMVAAGPVFLAAVPVTSWLARTNGVAQFFTSRLVSLLPGSAQLSKSIPAMSAWYIFMTYAMSGAVSAAAQAASMNDGRLDNNHPRKHINNMTGLPLRLRSAHYNMMEMFPGWALAAGLTYVTAPSSQRLISLLGLHVVLKTLVYYPAYVFDIAPLRSLCHLFATASIINVVWSIASGDY